MIGDSLIARICIRVLMWVWSFAIPFLSFIYYLFYVTQRKSLLVEWFPNTFSSEIIDTSIFVFLHYWLGFELVFHLYFEVTRSRFQKLSQPVVPPKHVRAELLKDCLATLDNFETWIEGWFNVGHKKTAFNNIYRENFAEWYSYLSLAWSFFSASLKEVRQNPEYSIELEEIINTIEAQKKVRFPEGRNPECECIRLTLDPVKAIPRPFVVYVAIFLMNYAFSLLLKFYGFKRFGSKESILNGYWSSTLEFDIQEESSSSPSQITYWYYNPQSNNESLSKKGQQKPIVFIHGVGGLCFYVSFVKRLRNLERPLFLVELPCVAMQLAEDAPIMEETVREIEIMLNDRGFSKATFVSHSLGTAVCAWIVKEARKLVGGLVLVDPIVFLLHYPDVAYNFVYRNPIAANEYLTTFFASRELYTSRYFSRYFHWFQSTIFISSRNILPTNTYVYLSEHDNIVPSKHVHKYLNKNNVAVRMMHELDHACFLFNSTWQKEIIKDVKRCCNARKSWYSW
ncbi:11917_t:CDS:2 [Acaulospora morrowiae]|uniref:11917_t:CDS:1 n=1 Tax=Acaulospora morrowiae TaxID=94023 RepID=A0A9N8ZNL2_9GLOM|nr:11917_t:CDS:2 [Acaulospora morrowiae]